MGDKDTIGTLMYSISNRFYNAILETDEAELTAVKIRDILNDAIDQSLLFMVKNKTIE